MLPFGSFLAELRRRRVFRVAAVYAVAAWAILQVATTVAPLLALPDWAPRLVLLLLALGFPLALALAWTFDLTPAGVRRTEAAPRARVPSGRGVAAYVGLGVLVALVAFAAYTRIHGLGARDGAAATRPRSVAVLPFVNTSGQKENEYFSDGVTEELLNTLAQMPDLAVVGRTSSFAFKGKTEDLSEIGRKLRVGALLEGSVQREGDRLRITVQLVDAATGYQIWSQRYDRPAGDVFALEDEISRSIADALRVRLAGRPASRPTTVDLAAHDLYLKGRYFWNKRTHEGLQQAIRYFQAAVARDSTYALAYSGLADSYVLLPAYTQPPDFALAHRAEWLAAAQAAAGRALAFDPDLAEAHTSLAFTCTERNEWAEAGREFDRALALRPDYAVAHQWHAMLLSLLRRPDEAVAEARRARELDPLSVIINTDEGRVLFFAGRYDEAVERLRAALELDPAFATAHGILWETYLVQGRYAQAGQELTLAHEEQEPILRAVVLARAGRRGEAHRLLAPYDASARPAPADAGPLALAYTALGDRDRAFRILLQAPTTQPFLTLSPLLVPLRVDPRWSAFLRRYQLTP